MTVHLGALEFLAAHAVDGDHGSCLGEGGDCINDCLNTFNSASKLTFKGVPHVAHIRHPLQIPRNGVEIDEETAEEDRRYRRDGTQKDTGLDAESGAD